MTDDARERAKALLGIESEYGGQGAMVDRVAAELSRLEAERDAARRMISCENGRSRPCVPGDACFGCQLETMRSERDEAKAQHELLERGILAIGCANDELRAALAREQAGRKVACVALLDLIVIADAGWYEGNEGHDWPAAVDAARAAIAAQPAEKEEPR